MSASINSVVLIGRLTRDPEVHGQRCTMRLAVNQRKRVKGEDGRPDAWTERANFFDVVAFGALAAICAAHLKRGRSIAVDGSLSWYEWQPAAEGASRRQKVEIIADQIRFLDAPPAARTAAVDPGPEEEAPPVTEEAPPVMAAPAPEPPPTVLEPAA